ncbi:DUF4149 domain-containing protein [Mycena indigotica]|uniref:DUF4149 domain-containing protein n=1 Tax=Mycena indigotica TaxID=2126181 RepID=A0A8H6W9G9_9AGAR|nr:DUF4149 domain-containing protein [Mycena indigotica]KAF7306603.1 DUF4149 domain-containing protein [Mycena indigotica]
MSPPPPQQLSVATLLSLVQPSGIYALTYAFIYGTSVWLSFFGGVIAYKTLPRAQFSALQHKTFPIYFGLSIGAGSALLGAWTWANPLVLTHYTNPLVPEVAQAYTLAFVILMQSANYFVIGPLTSKTMFQRMKLEKEEAKTDGSVSAEMKKLNSRFGMLHGLSSLANLGAVLALGFHGLWIGNLASVKRV